MRMGGQLRFGGNAANGASFIIGMDLGVAMSLAEALGYCRMAAAEMLPAIEQVAVEKTNEQIRNEQDG